MSIKNLIVLILFVVTINFIFVPSVSAGTDTPTPTPNPTFIATGWINTPIPIPTNFACPVGTPGGWMTVTPDQLWSMICSQCQLTYKSPTPTKTPTVTPTLTKTITPTGIYYTPTSIYTNTPTRTLTPAPTGVPHSGASLIIESTVSWSTYGGPYKHFNSSSGSCVYTDPSHRTVNCYGSAVQHTNDPGVFPLQWNDSWAAFKIKITPNLNGCYTLRNWGTTSIRTHQTILTTDESSIACTQSVPVNIYTNSYSNVISYVGRKTTMSNVYMWVHYADPEPGNTIKNFDFNVIISLDYDYFVATPTPTNTPTITKTPTPDYSSYCYNVSGNNVKQQQEFFTWGDSQCTRLIPEIDLSWSGWDATIPEITICFQEISFNNIELLGVNINLNLIIYGFLGISILLWIFRT